MKKYKLLSECKDGDWVYYDTGSLCQVQKDLYDSSKFALVDGYTRSYLSQDTKVYPITLYTKVIAEGVRYYYDKMHKKGLINGSRWTNWLSERFDELMDIDENADTSEFRKVWDKIDKQIRELEYHKSFL